MNRPTLHGAIIGSGHYNQLVRVCDAQWWQVWRWVQFVWWCWCVKQWPSKLRVAFVDVGEFVEYWVVVCGELKGIASENAVYKH